MLVQWNRTALDDSYKRYNYHTFLMSLTNFQYDLCQPNFSCWLQPWTGQRQANSSENDTPGRTIFFYKHQRHLCMCACVYKLHLVHCFFSSGQHSVTKLYLDKKCETYLSIFQECPCCKFSSSKPLPIQPLTFKPALNRVLPQSGNQSKAFFKVSKVWTLSLKQQ